ncbi:hypothetical protein LDH75_003902 [Escherichia coli]|nr:hypothetical protein [Escherichia coli]
MGENWLVFCSEFLFEKDKALKTVECIINGVAAQRLMLTGDYMRFINKISLPGYELQVFRAG